MHLKYDTICLYLSIETRHFYHKLRHMPCLLRNILLLSYEFTRKSIFENIERKSIIPNNSVSFTLIIRGLLQNHRTFGISEMIKAKDSEPACRILCGKAEFRIYPLFHSVFQITITDFGKRYSWERVTKALSLQSKSWKTYDFLSPFSQHDRPLNIVINLHPAKIFRHFSSVFF